MKKTDIFLNVLNGKCHFISPFAGTWTTAYDRNEKLQENGEALPEPDAEGEEE